MRRLRQRGYGQMLERPRPLSLEAAQALHCWRFMDGWHPERLSVYLSLYPCDDLDGMLERIDAIRDAVADANSRESD